MLPYKVDFFRNNLGELYFVYGDTASEIAIDDDYISAQANSIELGPLADVASGDIVHIQNNDIDFLGVVTDASPGEYTTKVSYRPFVSIFDEDFLFDTRRQGSSSGRTLEQTIADYITQIYVTTSDTYQRLPIEVNVGIPAADQTSRWSLGIVPDTENGYYAVIGLYSELIVNALKRYGVVIRVRPSFSERKIILTITKSTAVLKIDGNLDNVTVKTLRYYDRPDGANKLIVYDSEDYSLNLTFYLHSDRTFDVSDDNRIAPVVQEIRTTTPDSSYSDPTEGFVEAALDVAYSVFSGTAWDNLIELETYANDQNVQPLKMEIGQTVKLWYNGGQYDSILTGKVFNPDNITLLFGSERIEYTKRFNKMWRKN